jgi:peptidoglycan/LPS O-acetylase OafA/YrhL
MGLLRVILALFVVVAHSSCLWGCQVTRGVGGRTAVELFYIISGFYMALILDRRYVGPRAYRAFMVGRMMRLLPTYWVVCLATVVFGFAVLYFKEHLPAVFVPWDANFSILAPSSLFNIVVSNIFLVGHDLAYYFRIDQNSGLFCVSNYIYQSKLAVPQYFLVPQAWTLGVEISFYLIAPLIHRAGIRITLLLVICSLSVRLFLFHGVELWAFPWNYGYFPAELWLFLIGCLSFRFYSRFSGTLIRNRKWAVVISIVFFLQLFIGNLSYRWLIVNDWTNRTLNVDAVCLILPFVLPFLFALSKDMRIDNYIGEYSYPIYICHILVIWFIREWGVGSGKIHEGEWACLLTVGASILLVHGVERPVEAWRHKFTKRIMGK